MGMKKQAFGMGPIGEIEEMTKVGKTRKMARTRILACTVCALALCVWGALPGSPALAQNAERLDTVVVTAGRVEEKARNVTQSVIVISREEIVKNQYQDLGGILRNHGLQVDGFAANSSLSQISIRGIRSPAMGTDLQSAVLVLVDGRRVGTANLAMIPLVNAERVEIIKGPASVQYGTSAIGGVVNVITRRGPGTASAKAAAASAELGGGSYATYKALGELGFLAKAVDFSGGLSYLTAGDYNTGNNIKYHNTGVNYKTAYSTNLGVNFNDENRLGMQFLGVRADKMGSPNLISQNNRSEYNDRSNYSMDFNYDGGYSDIGLNWKGRYFYGQDKYYNNDPQDLMGWAYFTSDTEYQGVQGQLSWSKSILTLTSGVDYLYYDTNSKPTSLNNKYYNTGAFMLAKLAFFEENLIVNGGLRYDDYDLKFEGQKDRLDHTTPSLGIAWHSTKWLTLRSNYGKSFRIPQAQELIGFNNGWSTYLGNPDLEPEKGETWDAGFELDYKAMNFGLTYFQTDYKNKIASRPVLGSWDQQYYNIDGKAKFRGLEGQASYDLGEALNWSFMLRPYLNITHLMNYEDNEGTKVPNVSNVNLAYGLNFQHPEMGLDVDLRFTYYGNRYDTEFDPVTYASNTKKTGGDTTADLFVSKTIHAWEDIGTLSVKGEMRNLFDANYDTVLGYPQPGRTFYLGLRYDY